LLPGFVAACLMVWDHQRVLFSHCYLLMPASCLCLSTPGSVLLRHSAISGVAAATCLPPFLLGWFSVWLTRAFAERWRGGGRRHALRHACLYSPLPALLAFLLLPFAVRQTAQRAFCTRHTALYVSRVTCACTAHATTVHTCNAADAYLPDYAMPHPFTCVLACRCLPASATGRLVPLLCWRMRVYGMAQGLLYSGLTPRQTFCGYACHRATYLPF